MDNTLDMPRSSLSKLNIECANKTIRKKTLLANFKRVGGAHKILETSLVKN